MFVLILITLKPTILLSYSNVITSSEQIQTRFIIHILRKLKAWVYKCHESCRSVYYKSVIRETVEQCGFKSNRFFNSFLSICFLEFYAIYNNFN